MCFCNRTNTCLFFIFIFILPLSFSFSFSSSFSLSLSLFLSFSFSFSLSLFLSLFLSFSLSLFLSFSLSLFLSFFFFACGRWLSRCWRTEDIWRQQRTACVPSWTISHPSWRTTKRWPRSTHDLLVVPSKERPQKVEQVHLLYLPLIDF